MLSKLKKLKGRSPEELRERASQILSARAERLGVSRQARLPSDAELFAMLDLTRHTRDLTNTATDLTSDGQKSDARSGRIEATKIGRDGRMPDAAKLLAHFRTRTSPRFFAGVTDRAETVAAAKRLLGADYIASVVERAERIVANRFSLLGLGDLDFGSPPDWHREPIANVQTPRAHWSQINYLDPQVAGDKKITWELNRHQYFLTLGRAYAYTGDERFAQTFAAHLTNWMDENPPKLGINWASSLEVSFRSIAWLWALEFFKDSLHFTPELFARALKFVVIHARHLERYLSTYFSPNTHLTGEALGLYHIGTLLPELREASRWRAHGRQVFLTTLQRHVQADGMYFEQSSYYHRYTADFCLHFYLLAKLNGDDLSSEFTCKLTSLLDALMYLTKPDGRTPLFGDDDGGRFVPLDERLCSDFRSTLAMGAAVLGRGDYKYVATLGGNNNLLGGNNNLVDVHDAGHNGHDAGDKGRAFEEVLWLLGADGANAFARLAASPPNDLSHAFAVSGFYVMRDAWTADANYLSIDCGAHGADNCGHAHADALAFELAARGRTMLIDPGTYTYTGSAEMRDSFRSSAWHNTVTVDGESSSATDGAFTWKSKANSQVECWITNTRFDFFAGAHDGFTRLAAPAMHRRAVLFLKEDYWILRDTIAPTDEATVPRRSDINFHFAPDVNARIESIGDHGTVEVDAVKNDPVFVAASVGTKHAGDACVALRLWTFESGGGDGRNEAEATGAWQESEAWASECYGARMRSRVMKFTSRAAGTQELTTFIVPHPVHEEPASEVRRIEATGGEAFAVKAEHLALKAEQKDDILLVRGSVAKDEGVTAAECESDFGWSWLRRTRTENANSGAADDNPASLELVLIDGRRFNSKGETLFVADEQIGYARLCWRNNGLIIETDAEGGWQVATRAARRIVIAGKVFHCRESSIVRFHQTEILEGDGDERAASLTEEVSA